MLVGTVDKSCGGSRRVYVRAELHPEAPVHQSHQPYLWGAHQQHSVPQHRRGNHTHPAQRSASARGMTPAMYHPVQALLSSMHMACLLAPPCDCAKVMQALPFPCAPSGCYWKASGFYWKAKDTQAVLDATCSSAFPTQLFFACVM